MQPRILFCRLGLKVIQRNTRKFLELRFWGWWKLYNKVRPEGPGQLELLRASALGRPRCSWGWEATGCFRDGLKMRGPWRQRRNLSLFPDKAQFLPRKIIVCLPTFHLISQNKIHLWWREPPSPQKWDWLSAPHPWGLRHL